MKIFPELYKGRRVKKKNQYLYGELPGSPDLTGSILHGSQAWQCNYFGFLSPLKVMFLELIPSLE